MDIVSLPIEFDKTKIDSKFRLVMIAAQRARELSYGAKAEITTKYRKFSSISIEETVEGKLEFITGDEAKAANEKLKKFDYRRFLEERRREAPPEDLSELEKDLRVYLHEREEAERHTLEELFSEKKEEDESELSEG